LTAAKQHTKQKRESHSKILYKLYGTHKIPLFFCVYFTTTAAIFPLSSIKQLQGSGTDGSRNGGAAQGERTCAPALAFADRQDLPGGVCQADRRERNSQPAVSCIERGSERSRANPQERLQHLAAGTAGAAAAQGAGCGAISR